MKKSIKRTTACKHLKEAMERSKKYAEVGDSDFLVCDEEIFGDEEEHEVAFIFLDGYAVGHVYTEEKGLLTLEMTYPRADELTQDERDEIRDYDGIEDSIFTFRDIALCFGKVREVEEN